MTVNKFKEYIESKPNISRIIFLSENQIYISKNQKGFFAYDPCQFDVAFPEILIFDNPLFNTITLRYKSNTISFNRVTEIQLDTESTVLGDIVNVICCDNEYIYTLIIQYFED